MSTRQHRRWQWGRETQKKTKKCRRTLLSCVFDLDRSTSKKNPKSYSPVDTDGGDEPLLYQSHPSQKIYFDVGVWIDVESRNGVSSLKSAFYEGITTSNVLTRPKEPKTPAHEKMGYVGQRSSLQ